MPSASPTTTPKTSQPLPKLVYVKGGRYYHVPRIEGKKTWIPLTRVDEGRKALDDALLQMRAKAEPRTVAQLLARFAAEGQEERAKSTWHAYVIVCTSPTSKLLLALGHFYLENLQSQDCAVYMQKRKEQDRGPSGNREMATLSSAYNWGLRQGFACCRVNPCKEKGKRNRETPSKYKVDPQELSTLIDSVKPYMQDFLCVLYLTGFRMGDLFDLKREHLHERFIRLVESKNQVEHYKEYSKMLTHYLNRALEHATIAGEKYNEGEVSEHVFTNRYGRPLTYDGLRAAMRIAGNEIPLRQIRALAESHMPGTLGHLGQMRKIYTRTVRTKPVK
jgi:integrase